MGCSVVIGTAAQDARAFCGRSDRGAWQTWMPEHKGMTAAPEATSALKSLCDVL